MGTADMSNLRAQLRRDARSAARPDRDMPAVPGVIPDRTQESIDRAMAEAHKVLPPVPGTQVVIALFDKPHGLNVVEQMFGLGGCRAVVDAFKRVRGTEPTIVIASRQRHQHEDAP